MKDKTHENTFIDNKNLNEFSSPKAIWKTFEYITIAKDEAALKLFLENFKVSSVIPEDSFYLTCSRLVREDKNLNLIKMLAENSGFNLKK